MTHFVMDESKTTTEQRERSRLFELYEQVNEQIRNRTVLRQAGADEKTLAKADDDLLLVRFALVEETVRNHLDHYRRPELPLRPDDLPESDHELHGMLCKARGSRTNIVQREVVDSFAAWKAALMEAEKKAEQRLESLLAAAAVYERVDPRLLEELAKFIYEEYRVSVPPLLDRNARQRQVRRACRFSYAMSSWLLNGSNPPRGGYQPKAEPHWQEYSDDDDEPPLPTLPGL